MSNAGDDRLARLRRARVVAVLRGPDAAGTIAAVEQLVAGGVTGIEITYSTPGAVDVIAELHRRFGDEILLGAGTVLTAQQADDAREAGAGFLVSPWSTQDLASALRATGLVTLMGAMTPSEILQNMSWGADVVKLFPASVGGPPFLKALRGPFPDVPICPTGGVNPTTIPDWFEAGAIAVGAGSDLCSASDISAGRWENIRSAARAFATAAGI